MNLHLLVFSFKFVKFFRHSLRKIVSSADDYDNIIENATTFRGISAARINDFLNLQGWPLSHNVAVLRDGTIGLY